MTAYVAIGLTFLAILSAFRWTLSKGGYSWLLYVCGLALVLSTTLASTQLVGSDIHLEYYYAGQTLDGGWDSSLPHAINASLSVSLLAPYLAKWLDIDLIWVFKVLIPMIFALTPVLLFQFFTHHFTTRQAFLAAMFFLIVPTFILELPALARQQVAETFLAGFLLCYVQPWRWRVRFPVLVVLGLGVVVSHYSLALLLLVLLFGLAMGESIARRPLWSRDLWKVTPLVAVLFGFGVWYFDSVASGTVAAHITNVTGFGGTVATAVGETAVAAIPAAPPAYGAAFRMATGVDFLQVDWGSRAFRLVQFATQGALVVGIVVALRTVKDWWYRSLTVTMGAILIAALAFPQVGSLLNLSRYYHLSLMVVAPAFVVGVEWLPRIGGRRLVVALMAVYFLFTSGLVFHWVGSYDLSEATMPYSIGLENKRLDAGGYLTADDDAVAQWAVAEGLTPIYADAHGVLKLQEYLPMEETLPLPGAGVDFRGYVFLRSWNIEQQSLTYWAGPGLRRQVPIWIDMDRVRFLYLSGSAMIVEVR